MTENNYEDGEFDANDLEEALDQFREGRPRRDFIQPKGLDRESILKLNEMAGKSTQVEEPGDLTLDGVGQSRKYSVRFAKPMIPRAVLVATGLSEQEVPHVRVV